MKRISYIYVFYALLAISWLVSNHYSPWLAFHSDWVACAAVVFSFIILMSQGGFQFPIVSIFLFAISCIPIFQYLCGLIYFKGDALITFAYLLLAGIAACLGFNFQGSNDELYKKFSLTILVAGLLSMWIALGQWLSVNSLGLFAVQVPINGRIYANFSQPNQFATFIMLNICGVFYLYRKSHVNTFLAIILAIFFGWGLTLAQSRAGFLELIVFGFLGLIFFWGEKRLRYFIFAVVVVFLLMWVFILPFVTDLMGFSELRADKASLGVRHIHWGTALSAIVMEPWVGYGWNQVSVALARSVIFYPSTQEFLEHSHNMVLDIVLWNGLPLSILFFVIVFVWIYKFIYKNIDSDVKCVVLFLMCFIVHSMLEFPLEYAYFLMPFCFFLGSLERTYEVKFHFEIKNFLLRKMVIPVLLVSGIFFVGFDYLNVEAAVRSLRFEDRGLAVRGDENVMDRIILFDQQKNYILFARTEAKENMSDEKLEWMRKISERYGYAPALFRYAIASGLNGRPNDAINALRRICKTSSIANCTESRSNWNKLRVKYDFLPEYPELNEH